jgi:voltage-gated potassium channel
VITGAAMVIFYFVLPFRDVTAADTLLRLVGGILLIVVVIGMQVRSIARSNQPQLRSIEAVGLSFWMLVIVFSIVYVSLSASNPQAFSEPLTEVGGLYFTMSVLSTVGFGDISALTDAARVVVIVQMVLDLLLLGVVVRLLLGAGKAAAEARKSQP